MKAKYAKGFRLPGWLFLIAMSLYVELLLQLWTTDVFVFGRLATILVFAVAFGSGLGLLTSLFPARAEKWITVTLGALLGVLGLLQYFIQDAYGVYMPMISVFATAEGVATGYFSTIVTLLGRGLWRIILVMLPVVLYAVFCKGTRGSWKRSLALALAAAALYGSGIGLVNLVGLDKAQLSGEANFDGTVRSFGLSMGLLIDLSGGAAVGDGDIQFEIPETTPAPAETTAPTSPAETEPEETLPPETTEPPVIHVPHAYDLDFAALAEAEQDSNIAKIHQYMATLTPAMTNDYTGLFEGKNLILITAEAFSGEVIDPELTPTLYRMATEGIHFTDYYHQLWGCGTTGGEFANLLGIVPYGGTTTMMEAVQQNLFQTMGNQLQKLGYSSGAFHSNDHTYYNRHQTHTELGYDTFLGWGNGIEQILTSRGDSALLSGTLPDYLDKQPFSLYYMTLSGHAPYTQGNSIAKSHYDLVAHLDYSDPVKCYLSCNMELELAMEATIAMLEEAGIADDTVIVISTDHYPYGLAPSDTWGGRDYLSELYGGGWSSDPDRDHSALIIWSGCLEDMDLVVEDPVSALDILPTLSNLFGLEYDSRLMVGRDVFSDTEPVVFWPLTYSWKTDKGYFNGKNGTFTPVEGVEVEEGYVEAISAAIRNKAVFSRSAQHYNYFNVISDLMGFSKED